MTCVALDMPLRESYFFSNQCFLDMWPQNKARHCRATESVSKASNNCYNLRLFLDVVVQVYNYLHKTNYNYDGSLVSCQLNL